jgi:CubicO group peptidase (beta-lactamase class C family)
MHRLRSILLAAAVATDLAMVPGVLCAEPTRGDLRDRVQDHLNRVEAFGFSGGAAVIDRGDVLVARAMGFAEVETLTPFTTNTGFFVASLSKQFTAALILALQDRGLLSTADPIGKHLQTVPQSMKTMTIHQLLTHTSGLRPFRKPPCGPLRTGDDVLSCALESGTEYPPGARFDYSNDGYAFLAALAERIAGKRYEILMRELVFEPAGMRSTTIVTEPVPWKGRTLAVGYNGFLPEGNALLTRTYGRELIGPAGVMTTLTDMVAWETALREGRVLSASSRQEFFTPALENYACGWRVWKSNLLGERVAAHDGHIMPEGFNCYYLRLLRSNSAVIVLANRGDLPLAEKLAWDLARILVGKEAPGPPPIGRSSRAPETGTYAATDGALLRVHEIGGRYFLEPMNQASANAFLDSTAMVTEVNHRLRTGLAGDNIGADGIVRSTLAAVKSQTGRWGPYGGEEVIYTVWDEGFARTYLRHFLGKDTLFTALDTVDGRIVGGTDEGAFISGGRGLPPKLAYIGMAPAGEGRWTAYDFWKGAAVDVTLGGGTLTLSSRGRATRYAAIK